MDNLPQVSGEKTLWNDLCPSAQALEIAEYASHKEGVTLVVVPTSAEASRLKRSISFFLKDCPIDARIFPDWETLAYDVFSPHQDIISDRIQTLSELPQLEHGVLIVPLPSLLHRLPPTDYLASRLFDYEVDEILDRDKLNEQLVRASYHRVDTVYEHGEYAFRGSIIDIFPMGEDAPFRIDLLDSEIESLRIFDPETQRTISNVERLRLLPAREFPLDKEGINRFLNNWHDYFESKFTYSPVYKAVKQAIAPLGSQYYLRLFFYETATLFAYLPHNTHVITQEGLYEASQNLWQDINRRYEEYGVDPQRPLLPPKEIFIAVDELFGLLKQCEITKIGGNIIFDQEASILRRSIPEISVNSCLLYTSPSPRD